MKVIIWVFCKTWRIKYKEDSKNKFSDFCKTKHKEKCYGYNCIPWYDYKYKSISSNQVKLRPKTKFNEIVNNIEYITEFLKNKRYVRHDQVEETKEEESEDDSDVDFVVAEKYDNKIVEEEETKINEEENDCDEESEDDSDEEFVVAENYDKLLSNDEEDEIKHDGYLAKPVFKSIEQFIFKKNQDNLYYTSIFFNKNNLIIKKPKIMNNCVFYLQW